MTTERLSEILQLIYEPVDESRAEEYHAALCELAQEVIRAAAYYELRSDVARHRKAATA